MANANLVPETIRVEVPGLRCSFCGTWHPDEEHAKLHGCTVGEPEQKFKISDHVWARFTVGAGLEAVGTKYAIGMVRAYGKPNRGDASAAQREVKPVYRFSTGADYLSIAVARHGHHWLVRVEPLDTHGHHHDQHICAEAFAEMDLRPAWAEDVAKLNAELAERAATAPKP